MKKETILVVDDEQDLLDLIEYNLKKENYTVLRAEDGEQALQMAREHTVDLVLMDIMMPKMDGIEACRQMREDSALKHIPVIFLTADAEQETVIAAKKLDVDGYLVKPVSAADLKKRILHFVPPMP